MSLVPGDQEESEVRERYGLWAESAKRTVSELADRSVTVTAWPELETWPTRTASSAAVPVTEDAVTRARHAGWLVTGPEARRDLGRTAPSHAGSGTLHGLDVAVKDVIDVEGLPTANGSLSRPPRQPAGSAPAWAALAEQGARCIGKAATHEWAWGVTTPQIGNPADGTRLAGGSSGGSAAAVASGAASAALGTDTGGSIRIPAALCGVVGLRPTTGSTDVAGVTPLAPEQDVIGLMAGSTEIVAALLEVLHGRACLPQEHGVAGLRVGRLERVGRLAAPVAREYERTLESLASAGASVVPLRSDLLRHASGVSLATMLSSSARLYADSVREEPSSFGASTRALMTLGEGLFDCEELERARQVVVAETARLFGALQLHAIVTPTTPCVAPRRGEPMVDIAGRTEHVDSALTRYAAWSSATGLPSVAVPSSTAPLATSVQYMAPPNREDICLLLARFTESRQTHQK